MKIKLTLEQKKDLESEHRHERDGRIKDRIKAVLLANEKWTYKDIAQALRIHPETVTQHITDWLNEEKLKPENGGSVSNLTESQSKQLEYHVENNLYTRVVEICAYVQKTFGIAYTVSGLTKWLKQHDFRYKKPKMVPAKADIAQQEAFTDEYWKLVSEVPVNEPIVFMDAVHPTMGTKTTEGWIKKGIDKPINQTASKTRINITGAIELETMKVISNQTESVNTESTVEFLQKIKDNYTDAAQIHVIADRASYHTSKKVKEFADQNSIVMHFLPAYSPNLNPIERLWKVMNEEVRNNRYFSLVKEFREAITDFFNNTVLNIIPKLRNRINDDFQVLNPAPSG